MKSKTLSKFSEEIIVQLLSVGKIRTAETYRVSIRSFLCFRKGEDLPFDALTSDLMQAYEGYLSTRGNCPNTTSFYMRNLRAIYNRAVECGLTAQHYPFRHVYTGVDRTIKRAISHSALRSIVSLDLKGESSLQFARDMFLFSFYTRGMSFVDMAYLRKSDLRNGILTYRRRKTQQQLIIHWEPCMQQIVEHYANPESPYLLPIINPALPIDSRQQYIYSAHKVNRSLKQIGERLGLPLPLTMYVSRHSWASIAKSQNVPLSIISEAMGHDSESTTRIYLASLDTVAVDRANRKILMLITNNS